MVRAREGAEIALFISLAETTRGMIADAASAGFYESATGKKYPRVQRLTVEGLLSGQQRAAGGIGPLKCSLSDIFH